MAGVYLDPMQGATPDMLQTIAAGQMAKSKIGGMGNSPDMARALRDYKTPYAKTKGKGFATTAPSLVEVLGGIAMRDKGEKRFDDLTEQADVLRGEQSRGIMAQQQQAQAQAAYKQQQAQALEKRKLTNQQDAATLQHERQVARDEAATGNIKSEFKTWYGDDGQAVNVARTGKGAVDSQGNPVDLTGMTSADDKLTSRGISSETIGRMDTSHKRDIVGSYNAADKINEMNGIASNFTPEDVAYMSSNSQLIKGMLAESIVPASWQEYAKSNLSNASEAVKNYMQKMNKFSGQARNEMYGSALTKPEIMFSNMWLQSASGLNLQDRIARGKSFYDDAATNVSNISKTYGTDFNKNMPQYSGVIDDSATRQLDAIDKEFGGTP